ncbi:hypothetical protein [Arthrobacter sp. CAN_A1]|uniref:hypothetical protein n=1 Tax=Arthrobacter sp. CAN_A1 TaxID=2787717 RepID=UPI001A1EBA5D
MQDFTHDSEVDRELDELRARAYGPDPDIGVDSPALARLRELEAAHRADVTARTDAPNTPGIPGEDQEAPEPTNPATAQPSQLAKEGSLPLSQRAQAVWRSRLAWTIGALAVAGGIVVTILLISALRPAATLHPTLAEADRQVQRLVLEEASWYQIDVSNLRAYGTYHGLEIWSGLNAFGSPCLVAVHRASGSLSESRCAPPPADLIMDVSSSGDGFEGFDGLVGEGIIRFTFRGDTVDAYVYLMPRDG